MSAQTKKKNLAGFAAGMFCLGYALCLLRFPAKMGAGIRQGLGLCGETLIPSLLPFMVLAGFISLSEPARLAEKLLGPAVRHLFHLPDCAAIPVLMGMIGGYPVAARSAADLLSQGALSSKEAQRILCFCVNAGPAFLVGAVGAGMFGSAPIGAILLAAQMISSLFIGILTGIGQRPQKGPAKRPLLPYSQAIVTAVERGVSGMLGICGFVLLSSSLLSFFRVIDLPAFLGRCFPFVNSGLLFALCSGILEVTAGCQVASQLGGSAAFLLTAFLVSFSGVSVVFQVISLFPQKALSFKPFFLSRILHGAFSCGIAAVLCRMFPHATAAFHSAGGYSPVAFAHSPLLSCVMLLLCASILTGSTAGERGEEKLYSRQKSRF